MVEKVKEIQSSIPRAQAKSKSTKRNSKAPKVPAGTFMATVVEVCEPKDFVPGHAIDVRYMVEVGKTTIAFKERFLINDPFNERTQDLDRLLDEINAEAYDDLVGNRLKLTFLKVESNGKVFNNVQNRELEFEDRKEVG